MKLKTMLMGVLIGFLVYAALITILNLFNIIFTSVGILLFTFTTCCLVVTLAFTTILGGDLLAKKSREEIEKIIRDDHERVQSLLKKMTVNLERQNSGYDYFSKRFIKDLEIYDALKGFVLIAVYQKAIGKLRNGERDKALSIINDTENMIKSIINDPISEKNKIFDDLLKKKLAFDKMLRSSGEKQHVSPLKVFHKYCGNELVCMHCSSYVEKEEIVYKR